MINPSNNLSAAEWLVDSLLPFERHVAGSVVPPGYAAYARILHPARSRTRYVRWAEIAKWSGRVYHPGMQFESIATPAAGSTVSPQPWNGHVPHGGMPSSQASALAAVLRHFTRTPDTVWYLVWEGYGFLDPSCAARLPRPGAPPGRPVRSYLLYRGCLDDAADLGIAVHHHVVADYWFPEDRAWCVATDVDLFWAYVGGSRPCVEAVRGSAELECVPTEIGQGLTIDSDELNRLSPEEKQRWGAQ